MEVLIKLGQELVDEETGLVRLFREYREPAVVDLFSFPTGPQLRI